MKKIDSLGRVVIPKQLREEFLLETGTEVDFLQKKEGILLVAKQSTCVFCRRTGKLSSFSDQLVCEECISKLKKADFEKTQEIV